VQVCPTDIDIRDGLQYMCIGCGACVDACGQVMDKMGYAQGLIRYTSARAITEGLTQPQARKRLRRPRILVYATLLGLIAVALVVALATRNLLRVDVIRDRGALGREAPGGLIENVYRLQVMNASEEPLTLTLRAEGAPGLTIQTAQGGGDALQLDAAANALVPVVVRAPAGELAAGLHDITITLHSQDGRMTATEHTRFYVPR